MNAERRSRIAVLAALSMMVLFAAIPAGASGFRNPPAGADALGNAGADIVFVDDASAISHNPANLPGLGEPQALASLTLLNSEAEYESALGQSAETEDP